MKLKFCKPIIVKYYTLEHISGLTNELLHSDRRPSSLDHISYHMSFVIPPAGAACLVTLVRHGVLGQAPYAVVTLVRHSVLGQARYAVVTLVRHNVLGQARYAVVTLVRHGVLGQARHA